MTRLYLALLLVACSGTTNGDLDGGADLAGTNPSSTCTPPESAPDTSTPTTVVGTGAGTCTETMLAAAVTTGGVVTFNCGDNATINITQQIDVPTDRDTTLDGAGKVTLDAGARTRIFSFNHPDYRKNDHRFAVVGLTLANGKIAGTMPYGAAPSPCSQGFYDGYGGAIFMRDGVLLVVNTTFANNQAEQLGPDVGGGAISIQGCKKTTIIGSTFQNGSASNGGAIESLNSELDVYNSRFIGNVATGNGANSDDSSKCSVVATNGQHQVGSGGNGGAVAIDGGSDGTHTFCGVTFSNNTAGMNALAGAIGRTPDGAKQTTVIDRCLFEGNSVPNGGGGALYFHNSTLTVHASTFHGNSAQGAGVMQADGTTLDFVNNTFEGNATVAVGPSGGVGGVIALFGGDGSIVNCTFANNTASGFGAAIFGGPTLTIQNTLFQNNTAQNPGAPMQCQVSGGMGSGDFQFPRNHTNGSVPDSDCVPGITYADAQLGAYGDHGGLTPTLLPAAGSPAIGAGSNCPPTDQRGNQRPSSGCTSGAVEGSQ